MGVIQLSKITELFEQTFRNILINLTEEELSIWLAQAQTGSWQPAYEKLVKKMSTKEICELQDTINSDFKKANARNATTVEIQERFIFFALESWVLGYKAML